MFKTLKWRTIKRRYISIITLVNKYAGVYVNFNPSNSVALAYCVRMFQYFITDCYWGLGPLDYRRLEKLSLYDVIVTILDPRPNRPSVNRPVDPK